MLDNAPFKAYAKLFMEEYDMSDGQRKKFTFDRSTSNFQVYKRPSDDDKAREVLIYIPREDFREIRESIEEIDIITSSRNREITVVEWRYINDGDGHPIPQDMVLVHVLDNQIALFYHAPSHVMWRRVRKSLNDHVWSYCVLKKEYV